MFDFEEFIYGDMDGQSYGVRPDVSNGAPPMQPTTATGTGAGYAQDTGWLNMLGGTLQAGVNYAILRDQQKIAKETGFISSQTPIVATPQAQATMAAAANNRLLMMGVLGVGLLFALRGGK